MKNSEKSLITGQSQKFAAILANIANIFVLLSNQTFAQNLFSVLNIKQYITLAELSQLYCETPQEHRFGLRPLLNQIATDFNGWLEFFKTNHFNKEIKKMAIGELTISASATKQKQILLELDIDSNQKNEILKTMKLEAQEWTEFLAILRQEFDAQIYQKALDLAKGDKDKLLALLWEKNINNYRRARLCRSLLEIAETLTSEKLLAIYRRLDRKSRMRAKILAVLEQRTESFNFWLNIFQSEHSYSRVKHLSWKKLQETETTPENLVYTCSNYSDKRFIALAAEKLKIITTDPQRWDKVYELTTPSVSEIRKIILKKKLEAISTHPNPLRFNTLRAVFIDSFHYYPAIAERALTDIISPLPCIHSNELRTGPERSAQLSFVKSSLLKSSQRSLKKLLPLLAPKITDEEWFNLLEQYQDSPAIRKIIIKEYKKFFIQDFCRKFPSKKSTPPDLRNPELKKIWISRSIAQIA
jgi:hypothetical protein